MAENSNIQWTDATWNPTTGCTKVSPGCANCYIASTPPFRMANRKFVGGRIPIELHEDRLEKPLHWRNPKRIFVNSLSDLFHKDIPDRLIDRVFATMALCPQHTFQILTKRPERMAEYMTDTYRRGAINDAAIMKLDKYIWTVDSTESPTWPFPNVWLGTSTENQAAADERIPHLLRTPAAVRFLSVEPMLGPVDIGDDLLPRLSDMKGIMRQERQPRSFGIDWIIVGGESGPNARPCDVSWIRSVVEQCKAAGVPCFVKQLGSNVIDHANDGDCTPDTTGWPAVGPMDWETGRVHLADKKGGDLDEFPKALRVREYPNH